MSELHNHERFEELIVASFEPEGLPAAQQRELKDHLAACASCRESYELSMRMEEALVAKRADVPSVESFLPAMAGSAVDVVASYLPHPRLVAVFRAVMSPAGISTVLVMWAAMFALRYRDAIGDAFAWMSSGRFETLSRDASNALLLISGGDAYALIAIYVALTLVLLGSTGAITLKYIRNN